MQGREDTERFRKAAQCHAEAPQSFKGSSRFSWEVEFLSQKLGCEIGGPKERGSRQQEMIGKGDANPRECDTDLRRLMQRLCRASMGPAIQCMDQL